MPLQPGDILPAVKTFQMTFARDPMIRYVGNDREQNRAEMVMERLLVVVYLFCAIRAGIALTVDAGTANVTASPPKDTTGGPRKNLVTRIAERFLKVLTEKRKEMTRDPEAKRRRNEVDDKLRDAQKRALGDRVDKTWMVGDLWTEPAHQGHGYGGALLDAMTVLADLAGQATWLKSSNFVNTLFYEERGFKVIETVLLGDQKPTWHEKPVVVSIMIRKPSWLLPA